jgi:hypothetical protein
MKHAPHPALLRLRVPVLGGALVLVASLTGWAPRTSAPAAAPGPSAPVAATARSVAPAADSGAASAAESALRAFGPVVAPVSGEGALRTAVRAYYAYRAAHQGEVRKPYLYFVDFGLDNGTPRGWVLDMDAQTVVEGPFPVSHGRGSGPRNGVPKTFSNRPGSNASSLGVYLAQETYAFSGKSGGRHYTSVGLRLRGESGRFNGAARERGIVSHGAPYVSSREAGRSEGCPALEPARARRLLPLIAEGGVVFLYSPHDARWLREDPWISAGTLAMQVAADT